jgi:hypothetical protein
MSKQDNLELREAEEQRSFWKDQRAGNVFNLCVQGKDIPSVAETLSMKPSTIEGIITNKFFIKKLESHIRGVLFTNQVAKVIAASDVFSKLWDRVVDNIEEIPPEICLKELTKMFPQKKEGMIINPKNLNVFVSALKGQEPAELGERLEDLDLGYDGLEEDENAIYPELGEGQEQNGKQQRDSGLDSEESGSDK